MYDIHFQSFRCLESGITGSIGDGLGIFQQASHTAHMHWYDGATIFPDVKGWRDFVGRPGTCLGNLVNFISQLQV